MVHSKLHIGNNYKKQQDTLCIFATTSHVSTPQETMFANSLYSASGKRGLLHAEHLKSAGLLQKPPASWTSPREPPEPDYTKPPTPTFAFTPNKTKMDAGICLTRAFTNVFYLCQTISYIPQER